MEKLTALFSTQVGLEFFTLQRLTAFFKDSKIFQKASSIVSGLFANLTAVGSIKIESKIDVKLRGWLEREAYLALDRVDVYVPRNLAVPYSDYLAVLSKVGSELENSRKVLLTSTLATIGYYINAASGLKVHSLRTGPNLGDALAPNATKWIDTSAAAMSACLSPAKLDELATFTKAFKRNSEVDEVVTLAHELYAQQVVSLAKEIEAEALARQLCGGAGKIDDQRVTFLPGVAEAETGARFDLVASRERQRQIEADFLAVAGANDSGGRERGLLAFAVGFVALVFDSVAG